MSVFFPSRCCCCCCCLIFLNVKRLWAVPVYCLCEPQRAFCSVIMFAKSLFHRQCFAHECDSSHMNDGALILDSSFCTTEDTSGRARSFATAWLHRNKNLLQLKWSLVDVYMPSCVYCLILCLGNSLIVFIIGFQLSYQKKLIS